MGARMDALRVSHLDGCSGCSSQKYGARHRDHARSAKLRPMSPKTTKTKDTDCWATPQGELTLSTPNSISAGMMSQRKLWMIAMKNLDAESVTSSVLNANLASAGGVHPQEPD